MYKKYRDESKIYFSQEGLGSMGDVWELEASYKASADWAPQVTAT